MEPPWTKDTKFFVIVNHYDNDVSWAERIKFPYVVYEKEQPDKEPFNAINKAKSESNLIKFIYDFYDYLPQNVIIVHQYEYKWYHIGSVVDILNHPDFSKVYESSKTPGYWSFNNFLLCDAGPKAKAMVESGWWDNTMKDWFGEIEGYGNFTRNKQGGAQFVVSRERIHTLPREFYHNMYQWLVENTLDEVMPGIDPNTLCRLSGKNDGDYHSNYYTSRYMEWTWELIFTAHKKGDKIAIHIDGKEISALYGGLNYYVNVTPNLVKYFIKEGKIVIPRTVNFYDYFGDPIYGTVKSLKILNGEKECLNISEWRQMDVNIDLSEI